MYTLLPEQKVKRIKAEYRLRFAAALAMSIGLAMLVGAIALVPSYVLSRAQLAQIVSDLASLKKQHSGATSNQNEKVVEAAETLVSAIEQHQDVSPLSNVIEAIVGHRSGMVTLSSLQIIRAASSTATIRLAGMSRTREQLVSFKDRLETDPRVIRVDLPVSNLTRSKDITFNMTVFMNQ